MQEATFHIDHIVPVVDGGQAVEENLALACVSCSLFKGAQRSAKDPQSGRMTALFNPRRNAWHKHFRWNGARAKGLTATGRATIEALRMNRREVLMIRQVEMDLGLHPPQG
jgi:hypothetical protein